MDDDRHHDCSGSPARRRPKNAMPLPKPLADRVAACRERSLDALRESCRLCFQNLSPQPALRTAGIGYEHCCSVDILRCIVGL